MNQLFEKLGVKPDDRRLVLTLYFAFFVNGINTVLLGTLLPYIRESYGLDYTQSGMLLSAHQLGNLIALILAGVVPVLIGLKRSSLLMGLGLALGVALIPMTGNPLFLLVAFLLTGIGRGTWSNLCNTMIGLRSENKTGALNILHAVFAVGALLSPLLVLVPLSVGGGWQIAPLTVATLAALALVFVALSRLPGKEKGEEKKKDSGTAAILRSRQFWMVTVILFFYLCAESSIIGWFVSYFKDAGILSPSASTLTPTIQWGMVMVGRLFWAGYSGRLRREQTIVGMGGAFCLSFLIMMLFPTGGVSLACVGLMGVSMAGIYPTTFSTLKDLSSPVANGLCLGIATLGSIIAPSIVGMVADERGLIGGVAVILGCCVLMLLFMVIHLLTSREAQ